MKKKGFIILGIIFLVILIAIIGTIIWYNVSLKKPNKNDTDDLQAVDDLPGGSRCYHNRGSGTGV